MTVCACRTELTGGLLCVRCRAATAGRLQRLPALYRLLAYDLQPPAAPPAFGRTRLVEAPLPVSGPVLDLRGPGGMVGILEDWRAAMQAVRGWDEPAVAGDIEARVGHAARGLLLNLDWIADEWAEAPTFATEVRRLDEYALAIVCPHDTREHGTPLGPCPSEDPSGRICGAPLHHYRSSGAVTCRWCGVEYPPSSWPDLRAWMDHDRENREVLLAG